MAQDERVKGKKNGQPKRRSRRRQGHKRQYEEKARENGDEPVTISSSSGTYTERHGNTQILAKTETRNGMEGKERAVGNHEILRATDTDTAACTFFFAFF